MNSDTDRVVLSRTLRVDGVRDAPSGEIAVTKAEMDAIAGMLDLVALEGLIFTYRLDHGGGGRLRLTGRLHANVTQTCVVSLDPVEASLDVPAEVEFWPAGLIEEFERNAEEEGSLGLLDWPEAVTDGRIDLGPVIYETLATALDPYPKREGVS
ncbi:MAG: YceD family protein, partial [Methyloceanibacter sp.]